MKAKQSGMPAQIKFLWAIAVMLLLVLMVALIVINFQRLKNDLNGELDYNSYEYHIAIVADETDNFYWKDVYTGAVETGIAYNAYVEQLDEGLANNLSMEDAINVAIYENVDGILLRPADGKISVELINKAQSLGIPVITMQKDMPDSNRQGFVGINDYFLGQEYGKRVLKIADDSTRLVTVLFPGVGFNRISQNWFQQGLVNTLNQTKIKSVFLVIKDDKGLNNAEDVIHEIVQGTKEKPDVIICLDEIITQSVCQLINDRDLSEDISLIGSYISPYILQEIAKGNIDSTITIDPNAMGRLGIEALMTYKKYNMVSYYTEVDTILIDKEEAISLLQQTAEGEVVDEKN